MARPAQRPNDFVMRIAGESGEGVITIGDMITKVAARMGLFVITFRTFPAEIKGGPCMMQMRFNEERICYHGDQVDLLVAFNQEGFDRNIADLKADGVLLYEADSDITPPPLFKGTTYRIPLNRLATAEAGSRMGKNVVTLGVISQLFALPAERLEELLAGKFRKRGQTILDSNLKALRAGQAYAERHIPKEDPLRFHPTGNEAKLVMTGNEATALGALASGLQLYFGYPITPSSEIMEWLAVHLPRVGGTLLQTEDEMAALAGMVGASWAGARAMTATSGPGLSLMSEMIGLASMAEIPVVIVDSQRGGPSTGMPTKCEQSDLFLAVYGSHGDVPRVVIAPTSVEDSFEQIGLAFNVAEAYQLPVIVLIDQAISSRIETVDPSILSRLSRRERLQPQGQELKGYRRYHLTDSGVSPMAVPGMAGGEHIATGMEHDDRGRPACDERTHTLMSVKRFKKLEALGRDPMVQGQSSYFGPSTADIGVITWGSSTGPVEEAIAQALKRGIKVRGMAPRLLHPLPHDDLRSFLRSVDRILVPELNFTGQLATLLRAAYRVPTVSLTKVKGVPLSCGEVLAKIEEVAGEMEKAGRRRGRVAAPLAARHAAPVASRGGVPGPHRVAAQSTNPTAGG